MAVEVLDIVNACLATMGESPLNTLEEDHSYKAAAEDKLRRSHEDLSARSLWFNTEWVRVVPQADTKYIYVPQDVIGVDAESQCGMFRVAQRGRRLYDTGRNRYEFNKSIIIKIKRHLDFDLLPYEAQKFIRDDAVLAFQSDFDGDRIKYERLSEYRHQSRLDLNAEDVRQKRVNLLRRRSVRTLQAEQFNYSGHPWHPHTTYPA